MGRRSDIDWEKIERAYRLGKDTLTEIGKAHSVDLSTITRRAKKEGWVRDLSAEVRKETRARVSAAIVEKAQKNAQERTKHNAQAVEVEAISNALLIAEHEKDGTKARTLMSSILDRIAEQLAGAPTIAKLAEMAEAEDPNTLQALRKALNLPSYVDTAKKATEGIAKAIEIERKSRNLDDEQPQKEPEVSDDVINARLEALIAKARIN